MHSDVLLMYSHVRKSPYPSLRDCHLPEAVYSITWIHKALWLYASTNNKNRSWMEGRSGRKWDASRKGEKWKEGGEKIQYSAGKENRPGKCRRDYINTQTRICGSWERFRASVIRYTHTQALSISVAATTVDRNKALTPDTNIVLLLSACRKWCLVLLRWNALCAKFSCSFYWNVNWAGK